jgi:hypothetical protein
MHPEKLAIPSTIAAIPIPGKIPVIGDYPCLVPVSGLSWNKIRYRAFPFAETNEYFHRDRRPENSINRPAEGALKFPSLIFLALPLLFTTLCLCSLEPLSIEKPLIICPKPESVQKTPNASRFGIFDTLFYINYGSRLDTLTRLLGARPGYVLWFLQIDDPFPSAKVTYNASLGIKTVISMNIRSKLAATPRNDTLLQEIADGVWDSTLSAFAQQAAGAATRIYLRFGYEMNGTWFPWGNRPADFVAAWIRATGFSCRPARPTSLGSFHQACSPGQ